MLDQEKYKHKKLVVRQNKTQSDEMSVYELSRWLCLVEAVNIIGDKCDQLQLNDKDGSWVKPIAIQKYVDERTEGMLFELTNQGKL